jgi:hypothetical protein
MTKWMIIGIAIIIDALLGLLFLLAMRKLIIPRLSRENQRNLNWLGIQF